MRTMRRYAASVPRRGQVTIPANVRRHLGTKERPKVAFQGDGGEVRVVPVEMPLEETFGSVGFRHKTDDFEDVIEQAKEDRAR